MANVVEIIVTAKDATKAGFASATAESETFGAKMQKVGLIGAVALAGIAVATVDMAAKFDSSMTLLQTQAGVSGSKLASLKQGVLDLAGKVGFSPDSLAESAYHVASNMESMGATSTQMLSAVKVAAEGAAVGHANLVDVTNALGAAIASQIPGVNNYQKAMGVLNATVGTGDMKMQDLADAFGTGLLASVKGFGLSITDVGAALATFGDNNIRGAKAGTDLRMAVQALAAPTKAGDALLQSFGMTTSQLADDMRTKGLLFALQDLKTHMTDAGVTANESGQVITEMFGKKAGVGVQVLYNQLDRLASKYPALKDGANQFGAAWATTQQTLTQRMEETKASFEALAIEIGNRLMPYVQQMFGFLAAHGADIAKIVVAVVALVAALAAYAIVAKTVAVAQAALNLVMDANPFVLIGIAVIALAVIVVKYHKQIWDFIQKTWGDVSSFITSTWDEIYATGSEIWNRIYNDTIGVVIRLVSDIKSAITGGFDSWWKTHGDEVKEVWAAVWGAVSKTFTDDWNFISSLAKAAWSDFATVFKVAWAVFTTYVKAVWDIIAGIFKAALAILAGTAKNAWDVIAAVAKVAWAAIEGTFKATWDIIVGIFSVFLDLITGHWSRAWDDAKLAAEQVWNAIKGFLSTTWNAISALAVQVFNNMKGTIEGVWNAIKGTASSLWSDLKQGFSDTVNAISGAWGKLESAFKTPVNFLIGTVYDNGLKRFWNDVMGAVGLSALDLPQVATLAGGGRLGGFGGGDVVPALLEPGEAVVDKHTTARFAPVLKAMGVPGFASGGVVGSIWGDITDGAKLAAAAATGNSTAFANALAGMLGISSGGATAELASMIVTTPVAMIKDLVHGLWGKITSGYKLTADQLAKNATMGTESGGPGGGAPGANAALAQKLHSDWGSGPFWSAWNSVAMRESGWNQFATNPSSGAYGIPQALPFSKMPKAAWPASAGGSSNPTAQINWMYDYIKSVYGNPVNAWNHELSAGWYDHGGWLKPGFTLAYNGTGSPEPVGAMAGGGGGPVQLEVMPGGDSAFEQFMVMAIRNWVRTKGGIGPNAVQQAFGRT